MINADEMGLGKTVQAIGCINATSSIKTVLILCPKSMLHTWANELKRWLTRPLTIGIGGVSGEALPNCDILLINYDMISRRKAEVIARGPLDALICDEAHYLKNVETARTKAVLGNLLKSKADQEPAERMLEATYVWLLTGSPILNHPIDLYPLLRAVDPDATHMPMLMSFFGFRKRYCDPKKRRWGWDYSGVSNMKELKTNIANSGRFMPLVLEASTVPPPTPAAEFRSFIMPLLCPAQG